MQEQQSPIGHLLKKPSGGVTRGFAKPEAPVELKIAQINAVKSVAPYLVMSIAAVTGMFVLKGVLTASPNAQMVEANRVAAVESSKAIQEVARSSGCKALICVNVGGGNEPSEPAMPEQYGATVAYQTPQPKRWASRWGLYPLEQVRQGYQACQQSGWTATWPDQGLSCADLAADVQDGLIVLW